MKYFLVVFLVLVVLVTPAFAAAEGEASPGYQANSQTVTLIESDDPVAVSNLEPITGLRSAFVSALEEIFGEYAPRTYSVVTYLPDGTSVTSTEVVPGIAGMDWMWLSGVGLFALFLFCLMRFLGGAVK